MGDGTGPWPGAVSRNTVRGLAVATVAKGDNTVEQGWDSKKGESMASSERHTQGRGDIQENRDREIQMWRESQDREPQGHKRG